MPYVNCPHCQYAVDIIDVEGERVGTCKNCNTVVILPTSHPMEEPPPLGVSVDENVRAKDRMGR